LIDDQTPLLLEPQVVQVSKAPLGDRDTPPGMPAVQWPAAVEMLVKASHEEGPGDVGDRNDEFVVDVVSPRLDV